MPAPTDEVGEQYGTKLCLAAEVAESLSDVALDISMNVAGNGASPARLVLRPQSPATSREAGGLTMLGRVDARDGGPSGRALADTMPEPRRRTSRP
jgi:hypothetical protein